MPTRWSTTTCRQWTTTTCAVASRPPTGPSTRPPRSSPPTACRRWPSKCSPTQDQAHNKPTYPALLGLEAAKGYALELRDQALAALDGFPPSADPLRQLARYIVERRN